MKKLLLTILLLLFPLTTNAAPVTWDFSSSVLEPLKSMASAMVRVPYITATSTTATSTLPFLSITSGIRIVSKLFDSDGDQGTSGQILSSTGTGVNWIDAATGGGTDGNWVYVPSGDYSRNATTTSGILTNGSSTIALLQIGRSTTTNATTTGNFTSLGSTFVGTLNGIVKATNGLLSAATAGTDYENPLTFSAPLSRAVNTISCITATWSVAGCLSTTDFATFQNKVSTTSIDTVGELETLTGTNIYSTADGTLADDDLTNNQIDDLSDVAALSETTGDLLQWNGSAWTDVATTTLGVEGTLSFSTGLQRAGNLITCVTATGSVFGCLSTTDYATFQNKISSTSLSWTDTSQIDGTYTSSSGVFTASVVADSIGDTQLAFNTGQNLTTASAVTFSTVDTGQGANELFDMDQNVLTTSDVTFSEATTTGFFSTVASSTLGFVQSILAKHATTTDLSIGGQLSFGGVSGTAWSSFCTAITGGAGLCDGTDDGGSGGGADGNWTWNSTSGFLRESTTTNDVVMGSTATSTAPFFFDVSESTLNIGTSTANPPAAITATYSRLASTTLTASTTMLQATSSHFAITGLATANGSYLAVDPSGTVIATTTPTGGSGITSLNGQSGSSQTFATTSSNGGWGFSSASNIHTLNIPMASALNSLGLLGASDFLLFGNKLGTTSIDTMAELESITGTNIYSTADGNLNDDDLTNNQIDDLSDVAALSETTGDLLQWNGSAWADVATTTLGVEGTLSFSTGLTRVGNLITCVTATGSVFGCLSTTDYATFQNKISSTSLSWTDTSQIDGTYTSATGVFTASVVADSIGDTQLAFNTGQNLTTVSDVTFSEATTTGFFTTVASSTASFMQTLLAKHATSSSFFTNVLGIGSDTITDITGTGLTVSGGALTANCVAITGSADLCDGSDASGGGGGVSDWVKETNFGALSLTPTTTIPVWSKSDIYASSSIYAGNVNAGTGGQFLGRADTASYNPTFALLDDTDTGIGKRNGIYALYAGVDGTPLLGFNPNAISALVPMSAADFTADESTTTRSFSTLASSTRLFAGAATTTSFAATNLVSCDTIDTDAGGNLRCGSDATGGGGASFGQGWDINTAGQLAPTTTKTVAAQAFVATSTATSTFTGGIQTAGLNATGFVTLMGETFTNFTTYVRSLITEGTGIDIASGVVSVEPDSIGDTQLTFNTGQHLTTTSDVTFSEATTTTFFATVASSTRAFFDSSTTTQSFSAIASSTNLFSAIGTFFDVLRIPFGTNPTVDAAGEIALDTSDDQLVIADSAGTVRVFATDEKKIKDVTIASTSIAFVSGGVLPIGSYKDGLELTQYRCYVSGGTSVVLNLSDGTNDTETITCNTTVTSDTDVATNDTFTADEIMNLEFGTITGTVNYVHFEAYARITRE